MKDFVTTEKIYSLTTYPKILLTKSLNKSEPCYSKSVVSGQVASTLLGSLLKIQIPRSTESESLGVAQESIC